MRSRSDIPYWLVRFRLKKTQKSHKNEFVRNMMQIVKVLYLMEFMEESDIEVMRKMKVDLLYKSVHR